MQKTPVRRRTRLIAFAGAGAVLAPLAFGLPATWASPDLPSAEDGAYIVMLKDDALATYDGGTNGIPATQPEPGQKLDSTSSAARDYAQHLLAEQNAVLDSIGLDAAAKTYEYTTVLNGFAADLTGTQVQTLRKNPDVAFVWENEVWEADTVTTPDYLGLRGEGGVWDTQFGGEADAGAGVVVGIIDTGFWPENPSFAPLPGDPAPPEGWNGECVTGEDDREDGNVTCNSKVIGARYYTAGNDTSFDFLSPRDTNGHGSHVGGTSAGNNGVQMSVFGTDMGVGSGMAPAAQLAFYKALWQTEDGGGSGNSITLAAAIDDAVADGVDVINYSISGDPQSVVNAVELAFLGAAEAGVFVAASAGNSGDTVGAGSVAHNSPWLTTVAASTHDRDVSKFVDLGGEYVNRIEGEDRYATAAEIARQYDDADTVYIATGNQFADALAGAAPAAKGLVPASASAGMEVAVAPDGSPAPVLLTKVGDLPGATRAALDEIQPSNIVILGGEVAVSDTVETQLGDYGTVSRVAGADRYETAALLAGQYDEVDHVYVATGNNNAFPDALSGSALAGSEGVPVLLVRQDNVPNSVNAALEALGNPEVHVVGGPAAVSETVADELDAAGRLAGEDRYGTSVAVAEQFGYSAEDPAPGAYVATGLDYPDALAGSALAGWQDVPVVLSKSDDVPSTVMAALIGMDPGQVTMLGGDNALDEDAETELEAAFNTEGEIYEGIGVGNAVGPAPLVDSEAIPAEGATTEDSRLCLPGSLDAAEADDHIVICTRGANARTEKSDTVAEAGGVGMILANNNDQESLNADFHAVPSIHVNGTVGAAVKAYAASDPDPTAYLSATGEGSSEMVYPEMAGFSSYGPAIAGNGDLLKPDITGPGVDIIAAVSPAGRPGTNFDSLSGTSMSSPHIAGLAALMASKYPSWGPMSVKSAMMTTADPTNNQGELINYGGAPASALHYGSGEVEPAASYDTPLVYNSSAVDWYAYACAIGQLPPEFCEDLPAIDPSDLNYPSISVGALGGAQTITRTVTATGDGGTFTASAEAPEGMTVEVEPSTITVPAGGEATYTVTVTNDSAELDTWAFGSLTWTGPGADVRSPIAVRPVAMGAPTELVVSGTEGATTFEVVPGASGTLTSVPHGLAAADTEEVTVVSDGPGGGGGVGDLVVPVTVPEGTLTLRTEVRQDEWEPGDVDLDLYLFDAEGNLVAQSAAGGSDESITVTAPAPGDYQLAIDHWSGAEGEEATGPLHVYLPGPDEGNLEVAPSPVPVMIGQPVELTATWSGLEAGTRYLGVIGYDLGEGEVAQTLVTVGLESD